MVNPLKKFFKLLFGIEAIKKKINPNQWNSIDPVSRKFGFDRGTSIDRVYIEDFLNKNRNYVKGVICEIGSDDYSKKFGYNIERIEVLHYTPDNKKATIVGDLTKPSTLPKEQIDCFIVTQTLNFIYDFRAAIWGIYYMLKRGGVALVTVSGISQISRYDMERWGDYYRFTDLSMKIAFEEVFGKGNVYVETYGNVFTAIAFLHGFAAEELPHKKIFYKDPDYQVIIAIKAIKI